MAPKTVMVTGAGTDSSARSLHSGRTGDLRGNLNRVTRELARIRFPVDFDATGAKEGSPMALLPALHYAMLGFSRHVTGSLAEQGHDLQAKSDARFVENAWRAVREEGSFAVFFLFGHPQLILTHGTHAHARTLTNTQTGSIARQGHACDPSSPA
jgi:hypothetical protein